MADQQEVKKLSGTVTNIDERPGWNGRKGYRVSMSVVRDGNVSTLPLDVLMPASDPQGVCPFKKGETVEFEYTRKDASRTDPESGETRTTYFYNYRWPYRGGAAGGARSGGYYGPKMTLRATDTSLQPGDRSFSVELSCLPSDDLQAMAAKVNGALNALAGSKGTVAAAPHGLGVLQKQAAQPAPVHEEIADEPPF